LKIIESIQERHQLRDAVLNDDLAFPLNNDALEKRGRGHDIFLAPICGKSFVSSSWVGKLSLSSQGEIRFISPNRPA
jgi:hypothetical protein